MTEDEYWFMERPCEKIAKTVKAFHESLPEFEDDANEDIVTEALKMIVRLAVKQLESNLEKAKRRSAESAQRKSTTTTT